MPVNFCGSTEVFKTPFLMGVLNKNVATMTVTTSFNGRSSYSKQLPFSVNFYPVKIQKSTDKMLPQIATSVLAKLFAPALTEN